jgi:hypothetical protein
LGNGWWCNGIRWGRCCSCFAVAGIAYAIHGAKALDNARDIRYEVDQAVLKMESAKDQLIRVQFYADRIKAELTKIYEVFSLYFEKLKDINEIVKTGDKQKIISISQRYKYVYSKWYELSGNNG